MRHAFARLPDAGRLTARPSLRSPAPPIAASPLDEPGTHALGFDPKRDTFVHVPKRYRHGHPAPLVVVLHGAGGEGRSALGMLIELAEEEGAILVSPTSKHPTWDVIVRDLGPDVRTLDRALGLVFTRFTIDPGRVAISGFSDGASYALTLGTTNGDLFTHVIAFSPGFTAAPTRHGHPRFFLSHGDHDEVLPVERCSRRLVPVLEHQGYDVRYLEFSGPHTVPKDISRAAMTWFLGDAAPEHPSP